AAEHHLKTAAGGMAVDPGDHGHVERVTQRDAAEPVGPRHGPVVQTGCTAAALHVGAGAEGALAAAGQDDGTDLAIIFDSLPDLLQLALSRRIDRVQHLGPVDRDPRDVVRDGEMDRHHSAAVALARASSASTATVYWPSRDGGIRIVTGAASM